MQRRALGDREVWLTAARKVFDGIGDDCESGRISSEHLIGMLRNKLPAEEVESAVEAAMIDAGYAGICDAAGSCEMLQVFSEVQTCL